jgi:hypothetical protein
LIEVIWSSNAPESVRGGLLMGAGELIDVLAGQAPLLGDHRRRRPDWGAVVACLKPAEWGLPPLASEAPIGVRDIDSTPPATATS